jgi:hypothetical protein
MDREEDGLKHGKREVSGRWNKLSLGVNTNIHWKRPIAAHHGRREEPLFGASALGRSHGAAELVDWSLTLPLPVRL